MHEQNRSPKSVEEQDSPEPERLITPQEEAGQAIQQLDDPPQAEGPRERSGERSDPETNDAGG